MIDLETMRSPAEWRGILEKIAECCVMQGNYYSAAKKYTQAGNRLEVCCFFICSRQHSCFGSTKNDRKMHLTTSLSAQIYLQGTPRFAN